MRKLKILCTLPMDPAGIALLEAVADFAVAPDPSAEALYQTIGDADLLLVRTQLPADLFDRPNRLLGVVRNGTGLDLIPVESATAHGIPVANVPGANTQAVVEYCLAGFLAFARGLEHINGAMRAGGWSAARARASGSSELFGKTVGIVGVGAIGSALARACKEGFGMRVVGYQRNPGNMPAFVEPVPLDTLFETSDYVSLNCPLTPETKHLVNADRLRRMKPDAVLVNAARGAVVDEAALAAALRERRIRGAAVDVFSQQPLPQDHPLLGIDNAILTPHAASLTQESLGKMSKGAARRMLQIISGERPDNLVNPEVWERYQIRRRELGADNLPGVMS
jgi:D-3-phosphoglycerate dehydrogenase